MRNAKQARTYFPRGLAQPSGSFRFSMDALLLAAFAARAGRDAARDAARNNAGGAASLLDLGCGCGVVGLGCMLLREGLRVCGVDVQESLVSAAAQNARTMGLERSYRAVRADLEQLRGRADFTRCIGPDEGFDIVTANPPYRVPGRGREPASESRRAALFGSRENLNAFCRAAALGLVDGGVFCLVFPFIRTNELCLTLAEHGLQPETLLTVTTNAEQGPLLSLISARKNPPGAVTARLEDGYADAPGKRRINRHEDWAGTPPGTAAGLLIYSGIGKEKRLSAEAAAFCPFLEARNGD